MIIGFISDIHEDVKSLERALKILKEKGCDKIMCLGDIAGYSSEHFSYNKSRSARECLQVIREVCSVIVTGNHDLYACRRIPESYTGFDYPDHWYELDIEKRKALAGNRIWLYEGGESEDDLGEADKEFLRTLPEFYTIKPGRDDYLLSHHLYPDLTGSSTRLLPDGYLRQAHMRFMKQAQYKISFFGHNHVEGLWVVNDQAMTIMEKVSVFEMDGPVAFGVPCVANGPNKPGVACYDTASGIIESYPIYPFYKRILKF